MKVVLVTLITPASENIRGTSALPFHLIKGMNIKGDATPSHSSISKTHNFVIYSFNANNLSNEKIVEVEKELGVTIKVMQLPKWYQWMFMFRLLFLRVFLKYPFVNYIRLSKKIVDEIQLSAPNLIWVYGEELSRIVKQFPNIQRIQLGPDTESLFYYRMMNKNFVVSHIWSFWKNAVMYRKYARMEQQFCTDKNFTYYAVGEDDVHHMQMLNPKVQVRFLRHPHYEVSKFGTISEKLMVSFHQPKIKLLIAGQYNLYMKQDADLLNEELRTNSEELASQYTITFLGKGWEKHVEVLESVGYEVNHIKFAPDYIEEICKHDIQITPISIGTGTKGKVLDALANGLLVIGTSYALENIAVNDGESCVKYDYPYEVINILKNIFNNKQKYEEMATKGRLRVLTLHNRTVISSQLFKFAK